MRRPGIEPCTDRGHGPSRATGARNGDCHGQVMRGFTVEILQGFRADTKKISELAGVEKLKRSVGVRGRVRVGRLRAAGRGGRCRRRTTGASRGLAPGGHGTGTGRDAVAHIPVFVVVKIAVKIAIQLRILLVRKLRKHIRPLLSIGQIIRF